jgi:putative PIN family toxin of toxin-antitoxin system
MAQARRNGVIALSLAVYQEIDDVLRRPKFAAKLGDERREEILELLIAGAAWHEPDERVTDCRDRKDNIYLELALSARATTIITGDGDLLVLDPWRGVRIVRPAVFLESRQS